MTESARLSRPAAVLVVPYDPRWPARAADELASLRAASDPAGYTRPTLPRGSLTRCRARQSSVKTQLRLRRAGSARAGGT